MSEASKNKATRKRSGSDKPAGHTRSDRHLNKQYNLRLPETLKDAFHDECENQDVTFRDAIEYLILTAIRDKLPLKPSKDRYDF